MGKVALGITALAIYRGAGLPKMGMWRALWIMRRHQPTNPRSVRRAEASNLLYKLDSLLADHYTAMLGGKGDGKSCFVDTALNRTRGMINDVKVRIATQIIVFQGRLQGMI
jgi:hypothetical protein